jgi:Tol biopolymer transport system component
MRRVKGYLWLLVLAMVMIMVSSIVHAGRIAFSTDRVSGGEREIYKMGEGGEPPAAARITNESYDEAHNPTIAPGGQKVIYDVQGVLKMQEFADPEDPIGEAVTLTNGSTSTSNPCESGDVETCTDAVAGPYINTARDFRIIFTVDPVSGYSSIWMATVDISEEELIDFEELVATSVLGNGNKYHPAWCGDDHFVFILADSYGGAVCRREFDANGPVGDADDIDCWYLGTEDGLHDEHPSCDSEGLFITWAHENSDTQYSGTHDIWKMDYDGENAVQLTIYTADDETMPVWNPGDTMIAYTKDHFYGTDNDYEIYIMNTDGLLLKQLTDNAYEDDEPGWGAGTSP